MIWRRKKPVGGLEIFFSEGIIVSKEQDEAEGYDIPFKWSRRLITTAALAGSVLINYATYETTTYNLAPAIEHELNKYPAPENTGDTIPTIDPSYIDTAPPVPSHSPAAAHLSKAERHNQVLLQKRAEYCLDRIASGKSHC